jgi:hypothetical protein
MVTAACQPSSRSDLVSCIAAWPPPAMSTPSGPGGLAAAPPDCALGIARRDLAYLTIVLNGQF